MERIVQNPLSPWRLFEIALQAGGDPQASHCLCRLPLTLLHLSLPLFLQVAASCSPQEYRFLFVSGGSGPTKPIVPMIMANRSPISFLTPDLLLE